MSKAKSCCAGARQAIEQKDFSANLKAKIGSYYPTELAAGFSGNDADRFVISVLDAAHWAISELDWYKLEKTKEDMRAEQQALLKPIRRAKDELSNISPDLGRLLADDKLLLCADMIDHMIECFEGVGASIDMLPTRKKYADRQYSVAVGIAVNVLRILKDFRMSLVATADPELGYVSDAVNILKAIGDDIGLCRSEVTWRDIILKVKKTTPDLQ